MRNLGPRDSRRSPYASPTAYAPRGRGGRKLPRALLWWGLLLAPYVVVLLAIAVVRALIELDVTVGEGLRDTCICMAGGLGAASARTAFMLPAAWLLERVIRDSGGFRHLPLKIIVVGLYAHTATEVLQNCGYVSEGHPAVESVRLFTGLFAFTAAPLLLVWVVLAVRRWR